MPPIGQSEAATSGFVSTFLLGRCISIGRKGSIEGVVSSGRRISRETVNLPRTGPDEQRAG